MLRVREVALNIRGHAGDRVGAAGFMTREALSAHEIAAALVRRMALPAGTVRRLAVGDYEIAGLSGRLVADRTLLFGVIGVAELDPERFLSADLVVALPAVGKVVGAERTRTVVARRAAVGGVRVHRDTNLRHAVPGLRIVTAHAIDLAVLGMIEVETGGRGGIDDRISRPELMTGRTFSDVVVADRFECRVALVAGCVRVLSARNAHSGALALVTGRAIGFLEMGLVIELHLEASDRRELLELSRALFLMANEADRVR